MSGRRPSGSRVGRPNQPVKLRVDEFQFGSCGLEISTLNRDQGVAGSHTHTEERLAKLKSLEKPTHGDPVTAKCRLVFDDLPQDAGVDLVHTTSIGAPTGEPTPPAATASVAGPVDLDRFA